MKKTKYGTVIHQALERTENRTGNDTRGVLTNDKTQSVDLIDMNNKKDGAYRYILNSIDITTKKAASIPLKSKSTDDVLNGMTKIFDKLGIPKRVWSDQEAAFKSKQGKQFFNEKGIVNYHTFGDIHNPVVERFNRTMKFEIDNRRRNEGEKVKWVKFIDPFINDYNNAKHKTIKMTPNEAEKNPEKAYIEMKKKYQEPRTESKKKFNVGDEVLLLVKKDKFDKETADRWNTKPDDIHIIINVKDTNPITYQIKHKASDEVIEGSFYGRELKKA
jgi:hypothetical protein